MPEGGAELFFLDSRAAIQCARRIHNDFDPTYLDVPQSPVEQSQWAVQGMEFEESVMSYLKALGEESYVDLRDLRFETALVYTQELMERGMPVLLGAALASPESEHRKGRPDLLIRVGESAEGGIGYLPGDIKSHSLLSASGQKTVLITTLESLALEAPTQVLSGIGPRASHRQNDLMQLAHYWRILESLGYASASGPMGGLIGPDTFERDSPFLVWQRLDEPFVTTFSRSRGTAKRTALERYDHEFGFRLDIAKVALEQDRAGAPDPLVRPIIVNECDSCPWHEVCLEELGESDPSVHVHSGRLSVREWNALRKIGIVDAEQVASLSLDDPVLDGYWPEIDISVGRARPRLEAAIARVQMSRAGEVLRPLDGPFDPVPRADVEVDFDLEWDDDDRIYLWGLLVTTAGESTIRSQYSWQPMDGAQETALAVRGIGSLIDLRNQAESRGQTFRVYHYSHPEISKVRRLLERGDPGLPTVEWWESFTSSYFVDLLPLVKQRFFGLKGLGLKVVAQEAGFTWDEEEPSGAQTFEWIMQARSTGDDAERDAARERLLRYNGDDVRATLAVREWLIVTSRQSPDCTANAEASDITRNQVS